MVQESLITDEARAAIGRESEPTTGYEVSAHEIRRYCYAIDDLSPRYVDEEHAKRTKNKGIVAPPLFFGIPFARDVPVAMLNKDGTPQRSSGRPKLKAERVMAGGTEIEFFAPLRPGDVLTSRSKIADIYEKVGRTGPMAFTVMETTYTNQRGELVARDRTTSIAR